MYNYEILENILLYKIALELLGVDISTLSNNILDTDSWESLHVITDLWTGQVTYESDFVVDEYTEEFIDYTEYNRFNFIHPTIKKFFTILNIDNPELEPFTEKYANISNDIVYKIISICLGGNYANHTFTDDYGNEVSRDENVGGIRFTYDCIRNQPGFLKYLHEYISNCNKCIMEYEDMQKQESYAMDQ